MHPKVEPPDAAVVVPTRNRAWLLREFLPSLANQRGVRSYEVIIVNNGSEDDTRLVVAEAARRWPHVRILEEPRLGAAHARHAGAVAARSPLLLFIDDDMWVEPQVLAEHVRLHREQPGICVLGNVRSVPSRRPFERMMAYVYDGPRSRLAGREPSAFDCWGGHISLSRELYFSLGGFDFELSEMAAEDLELGVRLQTAGVKLRFAESAMTHHRFTARFRDGIRRAYRDGLAYAFIAAKHPGTTVPGVRAPRHPRTAWFIELACRIAAPLLEPFDHGRGRPITPLALLYSAGIRAATARGFAEFSKPRDEQGREGSSPRTARMQP
jgi:glycosyltransferase involved in cell wall biosynthesis